MLDILAEITGLPSPKVRIPYAIAYVAIGIENLIAEHISHKAPEHPFEGVKMAKYKMFFDANKAVKELGLPQSDVRDALGRAIEWFQKNGYSTR